MKKSEVKFKKGQLYRVIKDDSDDCIGCILRYKGLDGCGYHSGKAVKWGEWCKRSYKPLISCRVFQWMIGNIEGTELIEHESMVKFCKKLKKKLDKERKV